MTYSNVKTSDTPESFRGHEHLHYVIASMYAILVLLLIFSVFVNLWRQQSRGHSSLYTYILLPQFYSHIWTHQMSLVFVKISSFQLGKICCKLPALGHIDPNFISLSLTLGFL